MVRGRLTLGEFVAFSRYLVLLGWPLIAFGWVINIVQRGVASWERMLRSARRAAGGGGARRLGRPPRLKPKPRYDARSPGRIEVRAT